MKNEERLQSEKEFHNKSFARNIRAKADKYYRSANRGKEKYHSLIYKDPQGKKVLEYGCGPGSSAFDLARDGAEVTAIDISDVAIEMGKEKASRENLDINFHVMDAENLQFPDQSFDLICGSGILHHLDLKASYQQLNQKLKPGGSAVFFEPLGHNPVINLYRFLTPKMRTEDEHPLLMTDIELAKTYFKTVKTHHYNLLATIGSFIPALTHMLSKFDDSIFNSFPGLKKYSWIVVLEFKEPAG